MILGLAPMDGFTDCAMRDITQEIFDEYGKSPSKGDSEGPQLYLRTEFMTADGYCAKPKAVIRHLMTSPNQKNLIAQIHGGNITTLLKTVEDINNFPPSEGGQGGPFIGIELNLGCPAHNIMKSGGGSELLKDREGTLKIIKTLSKASKLPFSIKTRTGINEDDKKAQAEFILKASDYCGMITIHGRTVKQVYSGESDWNFIYDIKKKANKNCEIIGNGGITSYEEAKAKLGNLDGVMIGQSAIGNPRIFIDHIPNPEEKCKTILRHLDLAIACEIYFEKNHSIAPTLKELQNIIKKISTDETFQRSNVLTFQRSIIEFRKHLFQYIKWIPDSREFKVKMSEIKSRKEVVEEIEKFFLKKSPLFSGLHNNNIVSHAN